MFWFYLCLVMVILAALLLTAGVCIWVYQDAKERGERAWLWVLIILISSPLLGGLVYLIARREERRPCRFADGCWKGIPTIAATVASSSPSVSRAADIRRT